MTTFTRWILRHKLLVAAFWVVTTVVGGIFSSSAVNALSQQFSLPGQEAYETNLTILRTFGTDGNNPPWVAVATAPQGQSMRSPALSGQFASALARVQQQVHGARVASYATTHNPVFVSHDGHTAFGLIEAPIGLGFAGPDQSQKAIGSALSSTQIGGKPIILTGESVLANSNSSNGGPSVLEEALLGGALALLVLIFVFRSFMAIVPLLMAIVTIPTTFLLVWAITTVTDVSFIVEFLVSLIGLGVSIDYSLLVVLRWREERQLGTANEDAVMRAMATAGTSVLFSGTTVAIGLLALLVLPVPFLRSVGYGGALIPIVTVAVATTLLPVVLATVGPRMDWPRPRGGVVGRFWMSWSRLVTRRRWPAAILGGLALLILAGVGSQIALGQTPLASLTKSGTGYIGLTTLESAGIGPGALSPFVVLAPQSQAQRIASQVARIPGVQGAVAPQGPTWQRHGLGLIDVFPRVDGNTSAGKTVFDSVRSDVNTLSPSARMGGETAQNLGFISAVYSNFPLMIALIAIITFVLLARAFRSLLLPLKAVVLNVLSVAAAYGVMVLLWQDGYGSQAIWGIKATGAITSWVPLMVFAFLFGLSMDYEVFILTRMREEYDAHGTTEGAVINGLGRTGRLVTSGALILFFAFIALASGSFVDIKVIGTGLAAGILLDATVVRMLLVPALVALFGRWNWWMPAGAARILRVAPSISVVQRPAGEHAAP